MNSPELKKFIHHHSNLFWYTPEEKKEEISNEYLLETILNYGSLEDSLQLISIMGKDRVLDILENTKERKKKNYYPEIYNFFKLLLSRSAQGNIK